MPGPSPAVDVCQCTRPAVTLRCIAGRTSGRVEQPKAAPVKILRHRLSVEPAAPIQFLDVTQPIQDWAASTGIREGLLTVISPHTTARVNVNEREVQLQRDMATFLKRLVPQDG